MDLTAKKPLPFPELSLLQWVKYIGDSESCVIYFFSLKERMKKIEKSEKEKQERLKENEGNKAKEKISQFFQWIGNTWKGLDHYLKIF